MTATYVAWNGKSYPSPPPDGWYEASDGRWWAPGTGPNPPKATASAPTTTPTTATTPTTNPSKMQLANRAAGSTADQTLEQPAWTTKSPAAVRSEKVAASTAAEAVAHADGTNAEKSSARNGGLDQTTEFATADREQTTVLTRQRDSKPEAKPNEDSAAAESADVASPESEAKSKLEDSESANGNKTELNRKRRDRVLIGIVACGLAVAAGFAYLAFGLPNDDDRIATSSETSSSTTAETAAGPSTSTAVEGSETAPASSAGPTTSAASSITTPSSTTATTETDVVTETALVTIARQDELVAEFRDRLAESDLSGELLTADDIVDFGNSFCAFAIISEDAAAFDVYRQKALDDSNGELTTEELTIAINQAVRVFCPLHADRLGIA